MKIIIEGAGEVGAHLAKMLRAEENEVVIIDDNEERLQSLSQMADIDIVQGSPSSIQVLKEAHVDQADLFIAVYPFVRQEVNVVGAILAKKMGTGKVVARVEDEEYLTVENKLLFKELGIELMFYPEKTAADEIVEQLKNLRSAETMDFARGKLQISVFKLDESSPLLDYKMAEFVKSFSEEEISQFRIIAINRDKNTIIPKAETKFQYGDLVFTICKREGEEMLAAHFGKRTAKIQKVMIIGGGEITRMVAENLSKQGIYVKIVEKNRERCTALSEVLPDSVQIICGDGRNSDFLFEESISSMDAFVALTSTDEVNVLACVVAKQFDVPRTIAEVENIEYLHLAEGMGVDCVINKKLITAGKIFKFTLSGRARFVKYMGSTGAEIIEYTVAPGSEITKNPLKNTNFPKNAVVGGVIRGNDSFIAVGETQIEAYDRVAVFCLPETIKEVDKFFK